MAKVKFTSPISAFSGKIGVQGDGQVFYTLEGRGISRRLVVPTNPNTTDQAAVRAILSSLSKQYGSLTRAEADAWDTVGRSITQKDVYGRSYTLSGGQAYQRINMHRLLAGQAAITTAPTLLETVGAPAGPLSAEMDGVQLRISIPHFETAGSGFWRVRLSRPLGGGMRKAAESDLRSATVALADSYVPIAASVQEIVFNTRYPYSVGETLGVEILGLSPEYIPGRKLFAEHLQIT